MLKSIFLFLIIFYLLITFSGRIIRFLLWLTGSTSQKKVYSTYQKNKPKGEIHIDYVPEKERRKQKKKFKGGEYTPYEEVE
ncbi:MAG: hypothetical protein ACFB0B_17185 [Thermonemataceae bacterium]